MKNRLRDGVERGEDVATAAGVGFEADERHRPVVEKVFEVFDGRGVRKIALVVLQHDGQAIEGATVHAQIGVEALQRLQVVALAVHLRIGDEDNAVGLSQHEL